MALFLLAPLNPDPSTIPYPSLMRELLKIGLLIFGLIILGAVLHSATAGNKKRAWRPKKFEPYVAWYGEPPRRSSWDGSYSSVKQYLKRIANDPESIKFSGCTGVEVTHDGWLVGCNYRGANAFGGIIRQAHWFTIRQDQVVQMHDLKPATIALD